MTKTRVGIFGYGNLGRGVELACRQNDDMELVALFTRRDPATVKPLTEACRCSLLTKWHRIGTISTCSSYAAAARTTCRSRRPHARTCST